MQNKIIVLVSVGLVAGSVLAQESAKWKSGAGMITDLVRSPRRVGISELSVIPNVITVGTNATVTAGKFYVLDVPNNWVLADNGAAATASGMLGYAYGAGASPATPANGMIIAGRLVNAVWADIPVGTAMYVGTAGNLSATPGANVRFVGYIVAANTLEFVMKDVSSTN